MTDHRVRLKRRWITVLVLVLCSAWVTGHANTLSGTATASDGGGPIGEGRVALHNPDGSFVVLTEVDLNSDGSFQFADLDDGDYLVYFDPEGAFDHYVDEFHDNVQCPALTCNFAALGTPVSLAGGGTVVVDALLDPGASIVGTITAEDTLSPLSRISVTAVPIDQAGIRAASRVNPAADGSYALNGLISGQRYLLYVFTTNAGDSATYVSEAYENVVCVQGGCAKNDLTEILVDIAAVTTIDVALQKGAVFTGTVTETTTGDPIGGVRAAVLPEPWVFGVSASSTTQTSGTYRSSALPPGDYLVTFNPDAQYIDEVWDDVPCLNLLCDVPAVGTVITVAAGDEPVADATLDFASGIFGNLTTSDTLSPIFPGGQIRVYTPDGDWIASATPDQAGDYRIGLADGDYYLVFLAGGDFEAYIDELFDDVPCPNAVCDVTALGTAVSMSGSDVEVNAQLDAGLLISGTVTRDDSGLPITQGEAELYNELGERVTGQVLDNLGRYSISVLPGTYFVIFETNTLGNDAIYQREVHDDVLCLINQCDPTAVGTPVVVSNTSIVIDAALSKPELVFADNFETL